MNLVKLPLYAESWNVAFRKRRGNGILEDQSTPFTVVRNSFRYWAADPFLFEHQGRTYIFAELYDYIRRRGILGYCEIVQGRAGKWQPILAESFHMSYPYITERDGEIYILPEANSSKCLFVYRAVHFPDQWERCDPIRKDVRYADTTPFVANRKTYALTYDVEDARNPKLKLLNLDCPSGDLVLELPNPELRRPAGKVIPGNIRVAQNCAEDYGKGLVFYRYVYSGRENYSEEELLRLYPQDLQLSSRLYLDGMHTYNISEHYEVVDIKTRRLNLLNLLFRCIGRFL